MLSFPTYPCSNLHKCFSEYSNSERDFLCLANLAHLISCHFSLPLQPETSKSRNIQLPEFSKNIVLLQVSASLHMLYSCGLKIGLLFSPWQISIYLLKCNLGIPGWRRGLAPAFGPGRDPGDPGPSIPVHGACFSLCLCLCLSLSLCDYHK